MSERRGTGLFLPKVVSNSGWLAGDNLMRTLVTAVVSIWLARYLGPELFGVFSFAGALLFMFGGLTALGLNPIVVRELVRDPDRAGRVLGSAAALQWVAGVLGYALLLLAIFALRPDDALARALVAVMGFGLVLRWTEVFTYWFESRVESKHVVWVRNGVVLTMATARVLLILGEFPVLAFAWLALLEAALLALGYAWLYLAPGRQSSRLAPQLKACRDLLARSWPLFLSGLAVMVYMRIDQVMLGQMHGDRAVGLYSVAVRLSEIGYFIPGVLMTSVFPGLLNQQQDSREIAQHSLRRVYTLLLAGTACASLLVTLLAGPVIDGLFGAAYAASAQVLALHVWAFPAVALGMASSRELVMDELQRYSLYRTLIGCAINIGLNLLLIPAYGIQGAALATVVSYFVATFSLAFFKPTRAIARRMVMPLAFWR